LSFQFLAFAKSLASEPLSRVALVGLAGEALGQRCELSGSVSGNAPRFSSFVDAVDAGGAKLVQLLDDLRDGSPESAAWATATFWMAC